MATIPEVPLPPDPPPEPMPEPPDGSGASWWRASREELLEGLVERERHARQLQAEQGEILAEIASRGVSVEFGYPSLESLLRDVLHQDIGPGRRRVTRAQACNSTRNGAAEVPPLAPQTGKAAREGSIAPEHVDAITETLAQIPDTVAAEDLKEGERTLVELAQKAPPSLVRRAGTRLLAHVDPLSARCCAPAGTGGGWATGGRQPPEGRHPRAAEAGIAGVLETRWLSRSGRQPGRAGR